MKKYFLMPLITVLLPMITQATTSKASTQALYCSQEGLADSPAERILINSTGALLESFFLGRGSLGSETIQNLQLKRSNIWVSKAGMPYGYYEGKYKKADIKLHIESLIMTGAKSNHNFNEEEYGGSLHIEVPGEDSEEIVVKCYNR